MRIACFVIGVIAGFSSALAFRYTEDLHQRSHHYIIHHPNVGGGIVLALLALGLLSAAVVMDRR